MGFEITTTREFSAAHQLRLPDGVMEPLHGHNWRVKVTVSAAKLDGMGVVMDFHELERLVGAVVGPVHNRKLNDLGALGSIKPSAEHWGMFVAEKIGLSY